MTTTDQPHPICDMTVREGELSLNDTEEMKAERRRGRKRGKHNFEPGYKEMLFKEWDDFSTKHSRCPKSQEIQSFSEKCFRNRRKELEAEDPHHPLLVILEEPLDAIQVKNLFNNEKKKKKKQARTSTNGFPFTSLQGLPLGEAALMMQGWLQTASTQNKKSSKQQEKKQGSHQTSSGKGKPQVQQESSGTSDVSCRGSDKFPSPLSFPLTPKSTTPPQTRINGGPFNFGNSFLLNLDHKSEDESESNHGHRSPQLSGVTSAAIASFMDGTTDASSHPKALDPSRIRQSTAGEVIGRALLRQQQGQQVESPAHSGALHFSDCSPMFSPRTPPLQPLSVPPQSITSGTAMDFIQAHSKASSQPQQQYYQQQQQQHLSSAQSQTVSVNLSDLQQLVKDAVDEQVRKQKPQQQQPTFLWQPESPQSSYSAGTGAQIQKLLELVQEYKHQQGVLQG